MSDPAVPAFQLQPSAQARTPEQRAQILANPGFGQYFTDHMAVVRWDADNGWHDAVVQAYGPIALDPAASVLHYAQEIFEGLKAFRHADGSVWSFRPQANAARLQRSARRLALPELPAETFVESLRALLKLDAAWVPEGGESSLYFRPFMIADEAFLGVRAARKASYYVIASPAGSYFKGGIKPLTIWVSQDYTRAGRGGTGAAKCGGNYAASLLPQQQAYANGCEQVLFLDGEHMRYVEELGGMNVFLVRRDGTLVTPELTGTILEGVTRLSILQLARDMGHQVEERRIPVQEWIDGLNSGEIVESFACGTAASVSPIGALKGEGFAAGDAAKPPGEVTMALRKALTDIQYGRAPDTHGWMTRLA
ncbi:MAG: branched-chain amino acid aminotransferase [Pseudoxanthomonas sp.]